MRFCPPHRGDSSKSETLCVFHPLTAWDEGSACVIFFDALSRSFFSCSFCAATMTVAAAAVACLQTDKTLLDNDARKVEEEETTTAAPRNLTKAFEALCVEEHKDEGMENVASPTLAKSKVPLISPRPGKVWMLAWRANQAP